LKKASAKTEGAISIPAAPWRLAKGRVNRIAFSMFRTQSKRLIIIEGIDDRGVLFGTGHLLRPMQYEAKELAGVPSFRLASSPDILYAEGLKWAMQQS